jgi:DnaJ-domain-containing protein 1
MNKLRFSESDVKNAVKAVALSRQGKTDESDQYEDSITLQPVPQDLRDIAHAIVDNLA